MVFQKIKMELGLAISPKYLNDPSTSIFKQLSKHLLQYSNILSGFPLSFNIEGVLPAGKILENGCVFVNCLVTFCTFRVVPGDTLYCTDGIVCGIFNVSVEKEENFNGEITVTKINKDNIEGIKCKSEEESDF